MHPGEFYALPQSPQLFKQILMIAGMDRYVQIARCFRDEALRADRQLEFTQIDLEISFATPELVYEIVEGALAAAFEQIGVTIARPFRRMQYAEAIAVYGSDKPDLRFDLKIQDVGHLFAESPFGIFREAVAHGGTVRGFVIPGAAAASRRELDEIVEMAKQAGASGLIYMRRTAEGVQSSAKAIGEPATVAVLEAMADTVTPQGVVAVCRQFPTSLRDILAAFITFREEVITRRTKYELNKARDRAHILLGLVVAVTNLDEVVRIIRGGKKST